MIMKRNALFNKVIRMGKMVLPLYLFAFLPLSMMAQDDDMYFVPTKENIAKEAKKYGMPEKSYYSGINRSVDEYNRRVQFGNPADSDSIGNDIIDFSAVRGVYPDSINTQSAEDEDYKLTRQMSRFDDYTPSEAYWDGYRAGRWSSPWYNSWYSWYDPWAYDPLWYWNDPFYYSSWYSWRYPYYYSWYSPRYYGYYGYYRPWYGGGYYGGGGRSYSRAGVTHHKSTSTRRGTDLGGYRSSNSRMNTVTRSSNNTNNSLGGYRSSNSSSSGSFGGGNSGGFSSGGGSSRSSSSGGGGGGRSSGGGHSYGGRR